MNQKKHPIGRFFAILGITLLCLVLCLLGIIWVLERGPSPTVTGMFTRSVRETSAIRWISNIFLTDEELNEYKSVSTEDLATESVNTSLIHVDDVRMSIKKIAGVRVPVLEEVVYSTKEFSLFSSPKWFADGFEQLKAIADVGIRQEFVRRKVELLEYARKKTTQKVNLFEKVQIPGYQDAIRKIKRFMEDEENLSKSSQKIVKGKREAEARAAEERRAQA